MNSESHGGLFKFELLRSLKFTGNKVQDRDAHATWFDNISDSAAIENGLERQRGKEMQGGRENGQYAPLEKNCYHET